MAERPLLMTFPAVTVPVVVNAPTTVEDAFEMKPLLSVRRFEKISLPENVLLSPRSVVEATVIVPPREKDTPLMVPKTPVRRFVPMEVVETTWPDALTPRSALVRFGRKRELIVARDDDD